MNTLQTALEAIEILSTDNTSEQAQAQAADARIKLANEMAVEPVAHFNMAINETVGCIAYEYGKHNLKSGTPLYLHPPQQAVTRPSTPQEDLELRSAGVKGEFVKVLAFNDRPKAVTSGERAELIRELRERHDKRLVISPSMFSKAADMLEADAQPPAPTGWDNGLSQDYCKELGQWLASRPGARQQVKEMFEADGHQAYDQQAMDLCQKCGWKGIFPGEPCLVCNMTVTQAEKPTDWSAA